MRVRILKLILQKPRNAHQLSKELSVDYKTVQHHLRMLVDHHVVTATGDYGAVYFVSPEMEKQLPLLQDILNRFGTDLGKSS